MYRILCYGDSNTWGYNAETGDRFPDDVRWTGVLQNLLGPAFRVLEEGQPGRTTVWDDPIEEHLNGKTALYSTLECQSPVDLVILMLGTNDLKPRFSLNAFDIAAGAERLIRIIRTHLPDGQKQPPRILLVCPPPIGDAVDSGAIGGIDVYKRQDGTHGTPVVSSVDDVQIGVGADHIASLGNGHILEPSILVSNDLILDTSLVQSSKETVDTVSGLLGDLGLELHHADLHGLISGIVLLDELYSGLTGLLAESVVTVSYTHLPCEAEVPVYLPRCMSAFVGADITTALMASGICRSDSTALLADIGTNGEIALWHKGKLSCCSTAAGPAFEGANLSQGMQGAPGAIDHAWVEDLSLIHI